MILTGQLHFWIQVASRYVTRFSHIISSKKHVVIINFSTFLVTLSNKKFRIYTNYDEFPLKKMTKSFAMIIAFGSSLTRFSTKMTENETVLLQLKL